jgi:propanediol utilization protein
VGDAYALDLHLDTDEANAFALDNDAKALIIKIKKPI